MYMRKIQSLSIKFKLTALIVLTSSLLLCLASVGFVINELITYRRMIVTQAVTLADVVGRNSSTALVFDDIEVAEETLSVLKAKPSIVAAFITDKYGGIFAQYYIEDHNQASQTKHTSTGLMETLHFNNLRDSYVDFRNGLLHVNNAIYFERDQVGRIYLISNLQELYASLRRYLTIMTIILLISIIIIIALSSKLQGIIS